MDYPHHAESQGKRLKTETLEQRVRAAIRTVLDPLRSKSEWPPGRDHLSTELCHAVLSQLCEAALRKSYKEQGLSAANIDARLEQEGFRKIDAMKQGIINECPLLIEKLLARIESEIAQIDPLTSSQSGELRALSTRLAPGIIEVLAPAVLTEVRYQENPEPIVGPSVLKAISLQEERHRLREQSQLEYDDLHDISANVLKEKPRVLKASGQITPEEGARSSPKGLLGSSLLSWFKAPGSKIAVEGSDIPLKSPNPALDRSTSSLTGSDLETASLSSSRATSRSSISSKDYRELEAREQAFALNVMAKEEIRSYKKAMGKFEKQQVLNEYAKIQAKIYPSEKSPAKRTEPSCPPPEAYRALSADALAKHTAHYFEDPARASRKNL